MYELENSRESSSRIPIFSKICFWGITIDIFFLPYLPFMAVSASVVLVVIWFIGNMRLFNRRKEEALFIIMAVIMVLGTIVNLFYSGPVRAETSFGTAIKRLIQYFICFSSYFFYKDYFSKYRVDIKKILLFFMIYIAIFAVLFRLNPQMYATLKIQLNPADNHTRRYLANMVHYRFNYLWTDPNNITYMLAGIVAWLLLNKISNFQKLYVFVAALFTALCTVSNGGLIMLALMGIMVLFNYFIDAIKNGIKLKTLVFVFTIIIGIFLVFQFTNLDELISKNYISLVTDRANQYSSKTGGRVDDLLYSFQFLNPMMLIIGTGNEGFVTEIGHIYWIGMYGCIAYGIFIWIMFRKMNHQRWRDCIWMIPFFVGFTMNIAIGEYKWMAIYLFLLAYSRYGMSKMSLNNRE